MPRDIGAIDTMVSVVSPATLGEMDRCGVERALLSLAGDAARLARKNHPDRFLASHPVDPNHGMEAVRELVRQHEELGLAAVSCSPARLFPQVAIDDAKFYPIYAKCAELGLPVFLDVGVPDEQVPMAPQKVERLDAVCWFFPELKVVMRHGGEPWADLAVKLLLKWPQLYYSTSDLAPSEYPAPILQYANTRGANKILFASGAPFGHSLETLFEELPGLPLRDPVWPRFLRDNARVVLGLD